MPQSAGIPEERSDSELLRAAHYDSRAFEELFERHAMPLRQWLFAQTGDAATAHDLLGETFAQALARSTTFSRQRRAIGRRVALRHRTPPRVPTPHTRSHRDRCASAPFDGHDEQHRRRQEIVGRIDARELAPTVYEAFAELTPDQQRAIGFRVIEELSYEEVAERLNCSTITARTRVFRGLQTLRCTFV